MTQTSAREGRLEDRPALQEDPEHSACSVGVAMVETAVDEDVNVSYAPSENKANPEASASWRFDSARIPTS